jgi:serine/threonine protein kinase HipA of HipAB toxin-antitoxin module
VSLRFGKIWEVAEIDVPPLMAMMAQLTPSAQADLLDAYVRGELRQTIEEIREGARVIAEQFSSKANAFAVASREVGDNLILQAMGIDSSKVGR